LLVGYLAASACSASEGHLFVSHTDAAQEAPRDAGATMRDAEAHDAEAGMTQAEEAGIVRPGMRIQYQLSGALDGNADAELFVVDLFETSRAQIDTLHTRGRVVIAYISAGSIEPWRPDVDALPAAAIGNPLPDYPDEAWLDVREPSVRQLLVGRLTLAADKGFDGVLLVSLDAYLANSGHDLSADDQLTYNIWLAERAAQAGLAAGLSSDWLHAARLAPSYAFAIDLNCLANQRCAELDPYRAKGRPVFDLETATGETQRVCADASALSLPVTLKRPEFDAWLIACP
jgi:hypothetical protein